MGMNRGKNKWCEIQHAKEGEKQLHTCVWRREEGDAEK